MPDDPLFQSGDSVVHRSTREMGRVEGAAVRSGGEYWYRIRFVRRVDKIVEDDLDPLDDIPDTLQDLAIRGRWGRIQAFRCAVAVERMTHTNRSTVYSFKSQRILFEPYQYKPLLKVLDSPDRRLLIADEVGLGKTIEAGLILTEMEARKPLERVLIVCPSRLRDKWREELNRKFDQEFDILDKRSFIEYVERVRQNPRRGRMRAVASMQSLRSEELRELLRAELGHVDVVIVDEAHHCRNPGTQVSELLRELCEVADCVLLLTATPVHLSTRDLFTLLQAMRPVEFRDADVFDRELKRHIGVHDAGRMIRTQDLSQIEQVRHILDDTFVRGVPADRRDPLALQLLNDLTTFRPDDRRDWVELERRVQDLHPISSIVTRTRKRDVQENAPIRRAGVFRCEWTEDEEELYQELVDGASPEGWFEQPIGFGQIQRARQAASCLPAAAEAHGISTCTSDDDAAEVCDILPSEAGVVSLAAPVAKKSAGIRRSEIDSKYEKLQEILKLIWKEEPNAKVLIFTFFVGTAKYLLNRLTEEGVGAVRIAGDITSNPRRPDQDERGKRMRQFRNDSTIRVMVSTEVGSEGLDFQFCHHVVNYDLPWNPMVVEQRIGRIDRYGQKSSIVYIHNLVVKGTVEDRILVRLYQRIGIFRESIGDLEAILGETISELQREYVSGTLTPEEADRRVEQAAYAINQRRLHYESLEENAGELFGHEEYIRNEMNRVSRLGRFISEESLLAVIRTYLETHHPGIRLWKGEDGVWGLRLTDELRRDIQDASRGGQMWIDRSNDGELLLTALGEVAFHHSDVELINASHPLVRAARDAIREQIDSPAAKLAQTVLMLDTDDDPELPTGIVFLATYQQTVEGIRARRVLETLGVRQGDEGLLEPEHCERLLYLVLENGLEWDSETPAPPIDISNWEKIAAETLRRTQILREKEQRENDALYNRRLRAIHAEYEHDRQIKEQRLSTAKFRGRERIIPALRGQLEKTESEFRAKLEGLEQTKQVSVRFSSDPIAVCVVNIRRQA